MISASSSTKNFWNGEYYVSFGVFEDGRNWDDAVKYGFISAGHGEWYSKTLDMLSPNSRIWVNIPHTGYVGVGIVREGKCQAKDASFEINGKVRPMRDLKSKGNYFYSEDDPEFAEYVVKVDWKKTVPEAHAIKELGFFGNQNSVCRPHNSKWEYTIERLKSIWKIEE